MPLVTQNDNCVFPKSQNSQSIIDCFLEEANNKNIEIKTGKTVTQISCKSDKLFININNKNKSLKFDKVIVTTGGSPKKKNLIWLEKLGHKIELPVPSLFTFNMPNEAITKLMGVVIEDTLVYIQGSKLKSNGPLLITHWGMSGPAILKLSAFGARELADNNYKFTILVNWVNVSNDRIVYEHLKQISTQYSNKQLSNIKPYNLPNRLWLYLIEKANLNINSKWKEIGKKGLNKLTNLLTNDSYQAEGKTTFKEEFVTCGGISLDSINLTSLESKTCKNLYFAGEVLDVDGITGGYNFQAAWTTAFVASLLK